MKEPKVVIQSTFNQNLQQNLQNGISHYDNDTVQEYSKHKTPKKSFNIDEPRGKNKQRHLGCMRSHCKFRQSLESKSTRKERAPTYDFAEKNKKFWEDKVFSQLSLDTRLFIQDRFDGRNAPKDKYVDFTDKKFSEAHRNEGAKRKHRLFKLQYTDSQEPDIVAYL